MIPLKVGSINSPCQILELLLRANCKLMREFSELHDRVNLQFLGLETTQNPIKITSNSALFPQPLHNPNKCHIFAATESATLPVRSANQGGSFAFISMSRIYTKLPLSITDQVALLKSRGLKFEDEVAAEIILSEVCYFRFVQYLRPMEGWTLWGEAIHSKPS